ncbi:MAG: CDP-archaeol synthase [Acetobacteraceae bacterium]|nr:CDP-archaeol synthase [Acetobacteraceae bacterium]
MNLAGLALGVLLVALANGAPVLAKRVFGARFAWPLDGGVRLRDERPLFGPSKTLRGVVLAVLATAAAGRVFGLPVGLGAAAGLAAMVGDLLSSFTKRRLGRASSSRALVLDQVPESLLPLLVLAGPLGLGGAEVALGVVVFFAGELLLSRALFQVGLRDEPY